MLLLLLLLQLRPAQPQHCGAAARAMLLERLHAQHRRPEPLWVPAPIRQGAGEHTCGARHLQNPITIEQKSPLQRAGPYGSQLLYNPTPGVIEQELLSQQCSPLEISPYRAGNPISHHRVQPLQGPAISKQENMPDRAVPIEGTLQRNPL